jgi:hypothetical protein
VFGLASMRDGMESFLISGMNLFIQLNIKWDGLIPIFYLVGVIRMRGVRIII